MKSELVPLDGSPPIRIERDLTLIGRRDYGEIVVDDPSLSKRHCVLVRTDGLLIVRDLISTNGTKVNGQRVTWAALMPNDRLTLGRRKFKVYLGPDDKPSPSERLAADADRPPMVGFAAPSPHQVPIFEPISPNGDDDLEILGDDDLDLLADDDDVIEL